MRKIVVFTNEHNGEPIVAEFECLGEKDPLAAFYRACDAAKKDDVRSLNHKIPEKYLEAEGITMRFLKAAIIPNAELRDDHAPIRLCTCSECSSYEEGHCFRYGEFVDGFATGIDCDCLHGTGGKVLDYDGLTVVDIPFHTEMSPLETAKYLIETEDPELAALKEKILEFDDMYEEDEENWPESSLREDIWSFDEDCG